MTDADDAGLVELQAFDAAWDAYVRDMRMGSHYSILMKTQARIAPARDKLAQAINAQRREIEELRRELEKAIKALREIRTKDEAKSALAAASAFAAKHGGQDG